MWKIYNQDKIEILKKSQENLEMSQKNTQMLAGIIQKHMELLDKEEEKFEKTEEEKKLAAYALNLCTVSISQIIDYNDIHFLEYEYDAILNNLNLEKMPKDEALLRILKQLLDVITFFRLQEGDRKLLEKEYEQRIKNAIWSAIPNPTMIMAGGDLLAVGISLATQVGIGYMNYRREKAGIALDKERKEWELQRSAMEQFNGLRRELFDTAWRLADEYGFQDEWRLTERQITQFNNILLDSDDRRRYERLECIHTKFEAYPPFFYYLGHAANMVSQDLRYDVSIRKKFKEDAVKSFEKFFECTKQNLLREDQLVASCALEWFDLTEDEQLLETAITASGSSFDVLQICAVSYLKIGKVDEACNILKMLINEEHNEILNAQLLSKLYVLEVIAANKNKDEESKGKLEEYKMAYNLLAMRFAQTEYLFPLPENLPTTNKEQAELENNFVRLQKVNLRFNYAEAMGNYITICECKYRNVCKLNGNIAEEMATFIKEVSNAAEKIVGKDKKIFFLQKIKESISQNDEFKKMLLHGAERAKGTQLITFEEIFGNAFRFIADIINLQIDKTNDMKEISQLENDLYTFICQNDLSDDKLGVVVITVDAIDEIFGQEFKDELQKSQTSNQFLSAICEGNFSQQEIVKKGNDTKLLLRGGKSFKDYVKRNFDIFRMFTTQDEIIAVLNDTSVRDTDLIFTTKLVIVIGRTFIPIKKQFKDVCKYKDIEIDESDNKIIIGKYGYHNADIDVKKLKDMIDKFAEISGQNIELRSEGLAAEISLAIINHARDINAKMDEDIDWERVEEEMRDQRGWEG